MNDAKIVKPRNKKEREIATKVDVHYWRYVDCYYANGRMMPDATRATAFELALASAKEDAKQFAKTPEDYNRLMTPKSVRIVNANALVRP